MANSYYGAIGHSTLLIKAQFSCFLGKVFQDRLLLFKPKVNEVFYNDISVVEYQKCRDYFLNYLLVSISLTLFFLVLVQEFSHTFLFVGLFALFLSFIIKREKSFIRIIVKEAFVITIGLKRKEEKKGQIFVKKIKQHLN